MFRPFGATVA